MTRAAFWAAAVTLLNVCSRPGPGAEVAGKIILQKNVKRPTVTATAYNLRAGAAELPSPERRSASPFERVAVWLESDRAESVAPVTTTIEQRNHRFEPQLVIVPKGSTV